MLIEANQLCKDFKSKQKGKSRLTIGKNVWKRAVNQVSFSIDEGEIVGFIGPNGAGKSTTIKMLAGILMPTSGTVRVDGLDPFKDRKENSYKIGVVFGQRSQLWWHLKLEDSLNLLRYIYNVPQEEYKKRLEMLQGILELSEFWNQPVRTLSLGQRMRGELAAAMIHRPKMLFLDEPTIGMDVLVKERIRAMLLEINRLEKTTIFLTTHDLDDVERLCPRVLLINHGEKLYDGSMAELRAKSSGDVTVRLDTAGEPVIPEGLRNVQKEGNRLSFSFRRNQEETLLSTVLSQNQVLDMSVKEIPIEDVIRGFYEEGNADV